MKPEDGEGRGTREGQPLADVVPLPRRRQRPVLEPEPRTVPSVESRREPKSFFDWLGVEDLVPLGPAPLDRPERSERDPGPEAERLVGPEAFWTESSELLQSPLNGPVPGRTARPDTRAPRPDAPPIARPAWAGHGRASRLAAAATVLLTAACLAAVVGRAQPPAGSISARAIAFLTPAPAQAQTMPSRAPEPRRRVALPATLSRHAASRRRGHRAHPPRPASAAGGAGAGRGSSGTVVSYTTGQSTQDPAQASPQSHPQSTATSSAAKGSASSGSGPVGPGAPFGPGQMG